jgi:hypothetical protein
VGDMLVKEKCDRGHVHSWPAWSLTVLVPVGEAP